jgi:hypothetical protein
VDRVDPGGRAVQGLAVPGQGDRVDPVVLALVQDPVGRVGRVVQGLAVTGRVDLVVPHPVDLADIRDPVVLAGPVDLLVLGRVGPVDQDMDRADLVVLGRAARAELDLVGRVGLGDRGMGPVDLVDLADRVDPAARADRVDLGDQDMDRAGRVDRRHRRTPPGVITTGVAPRWVAPGMRRTASAHPAMARRLRLHSTDGAGTAGLRPERRRLTGTGRRLRVAGTVHRRPVVGTAHGMGRRAIWQSHRPISGRSITTDITPFRCSTRCLVGGASGSSESGFRCTDTT